MTDYTFIDTLNMFEHGYRGIIRTLDGDTVYIDEPEKFKQEFKEDTDKKFRVTDSNGNYLKLDVVEKGYDDANKRFEGYNDLLHVNKYDYGDGREEGGDPRRNFVLSIAVDMARKRGLGEQGDKAIEGYVISKFDSIQTRLAKYYGINWFKFAKVENPFRVIIVSFLKHYLQKDIDNIVMSFQEGVLKSNYMNDKPGMTQMLNVNYTPVIEDEKAMVDTGVDESLNPDLYRAEMNRINEMKNKKKQPEGVYHESKTQQKLR